jgi:hypothetical protein
MDIWNWFVTSSADPKNTSLALKGMLTIGAGQLVHLFGFLCTVGLYCVSVTIGELSQLVDLITNIAFWGLSIAGAVFTAWGMIRKWANGRWSPAPIDA